MANEFATLLSAATVLTPLLTGCTVETPLASSKTVETPLASSATVEAALASSAAVEVTDFPGTNRNTIIFVVDDLAREVLKAYDKPTHSGLTAVHANQWASGSFTYPATPNIDALANSGLVFERFNTAATCSPTRATLMTGRDNNKHTLGQALRVTPSGDENGPFKAEGTTIYSWMEQQGSGYIRAHIGKWHQTESYGHDFGGGLNADNSAIAFQRVVDVGRAHYYAGGLMNFGEAVPGFPLEDLGGSDQHHARWTFCIDDQRPTGLVANLEADSAVGDRSDPDSFIMGSTFQHSLIWEVERCKEVIQRIELSGRPLFMTVMFHGAHEPIDWVSMAGEQLSIAGYHSRGTSDPGDDMGRSLAFLESMDYAIGEILGALSTAQRANTMVVYMSDNGTTGGLLDSTANPISLPAAGPTGNPYNSSLGKASPYQSGTGGALIIQGPEVADPGDGTHPRFWTGLCDVSDLFYEIARWTGTHVYADQQNGTSVIRKAVENTGSAGKQTHVARRFANGNALDMYADTPCWITSQNETGWKILYLKRTPTETPVWELYDLTADALEETDIFDAAWTGTVQGTYDALTSGQQAGFAECYQAIAYEGLVPDGMEVTL